MSDTKDVDCCRFVFAYRRNSDGSIDLICLICFLTAATADNEAELHEREKSHCCSGRPPDLVRKTNARKVSKPVTGKDERGEQGEGGRGAGGAVGEGSRRGRWWTTGTWKSGMMRAHGFLGVATGEGAPAGAVGHR
jgi:hypothetical protein